MAASPERPEISTEFSTVVENRLGATSPQMAGTARGPLADPLAGKEAEDDTTRVRGRVC
jgi:hypothetical protein